jgi:hypothetical protein
MVGIVAFESIAAMNTTFSPVVAPEGEGTLIDVPDDWVNAVTDSITGNATAIHPLLMRETDANILDARSTK